MSDGKKLKDNPVFKAAVKGSGLKIEDFPDIELVEEDQPREMDINKVIENMEKGSGLKLPKET